jgi:alkylation response protein AidB-like acyl-CoA dehydrogenase
MTLTRVDHDRRLARAHEVGVVLDAEAAAGAAAGALTPRAVEALLGTGFMNMGVARELGGEQCSYREWADVIEEVSRSDGAAGWSLMATSSHAASFSSVLPDRGAAELYAGGPPVISGMPAPRGHAERVDGGYHFTGKHQFASGSMMCDHFVAGGLVHEDGDLVFADNGMPEMIAVIVPRKDVRETGNWDVSGLAGTASIDYEVGPMFVPEHLAVQVNPWVSKVYRGTSFWALGVEILGPLGHLAPALGVSRRALQEIAALAPMRRRRDGPYAPVGDQPHFQYELSRHAAELDAARLLFHDLLRELDEWTLHNDRPAPRELCDRTKQTARYVHDVAVRCVDFAFDWSGSTGLRVDGVIGRNFRDVHAMNQHIAVDRHNYIDAAPSVMARLAGGVAEFHTREVR